MKNLKTLLAVMLLTMGTLTASAQEVEYSFKPHAFLNLQGGAQYTLTDAKFKDLLSPNVQAGIGYQFSPVVGVRLAASGWQSKGGFDEPTNLSYKFNYVAGNIDLMFNLSNLFFGWKPKRFLNVTALVGGGGNFAWKNDEAIALQNQTGRLTNIWEGTQKRTTARAGLQFDFRLSDCVGFLLEGNANTISDYYNSKQSGNADWYFNALAGFRINLGKAYTTRTIAAPEPEPVYIEPVAQPEPVVVEPEPEPVIVRVEPLRREVFFERNKTIIRDTETQKIEDIANYLNQYPDATVNIVGYADAGTGNDKINDRLAAGRADVVVKALIEQYGISADRINYDSKGARVQPFEVNDMNRVTICIAE